MSEIGKTASAVHHCLDRGWVPVRVEKQGKRPIGEGWQKLRPTRAEVATWHGNVGVLLGSASGWLVDVDLDCEEAVTLAPHYLADSWVFGRASKPASHWLYIAEGARSHQFRDDGDAVMLELRCETSNGPGHQTVIPPSIHVSGEAIEWDPDHGDAMEMPRAIDARELAVDVCRLVRATLYMRRGLSADEARAKEAAHVPKARPAIPLQTRCPKRGDVRERARKYLARMPEAVEHQGGHLTTFKAAVAMVRGFQLDEHDALALLRDDYNPRCAPPWSERELEHKVKQAARARVASGYLLEGRP